jgi:Restriction endonuclease EcoRV
MPTLTFEAFREAFDQEVSRLKITWESVGFYAPDGRVYAFGTDTKVISTVFEALAAPLIKKIADDNSYIVESSQQTVYPDFTLSPSPGCPPRIAIDIKTTYRRFTRKGEIQPFRYTLGSYTSFLRTPGATKNIRYPYAQYSDQWVIGFLYTRREGVASKVYSKPEELKNMLCPYTDVEYFIQHKYRIVGSSPASGNTANIGSFPTNNIQDLRDGKGPFAKLGKEQCDAYWRNYARTAAERAKSYSNIDEFLAWVANQSTEAQE